MRGSISPPKNIDALLTLERTYLICKKNENDGAFLVSFAWNNGGRARISLHSSRVGEEGGKPGSHGLCTS